MNRYSKRPTRVGFPISGASTRATTPAERLGTALDDRRPLLRSVDRYGSSLPSGSSTRGAKGRDGRGTGGATSRPRSPSLSERNPRTLPEAQAKRYRGGPRSRPESQRGKSSSRQSTRSKNGLHALRDLKRQSRDRGDQTEIAGEVLTAAHHAGIAAGVGILGGVYPTPYLGGNRTLSGSYSSTDCYYNPWGYSYYGSRFRFSFGYSNHYFNAGYANFWPFYLSCWYPLWHTYYHPSYYYNSIPFYYKNTADRTVYIEDPVEETAPAESILEEPSPRESGPTAALPEDTRDTLETTADRYLELGDQAFRDARYTDAVQLYAKAVEYAPEEASLYLVLGDALFAAGDYHYGAYVVRKSLEIDPALAAAEVDKHDFYTDPADFDQQLAALETYLIQHPNNRDARLLLALNYLFGARPAAAVDLLEAPAAASLGGDFAAELILDAARRIQHGKSDSQPGS